VTNTKWNGIIKLVVEVKCIRIILNPNLIDLVVFCMDMEDLNREFLRDDRAIIRVGVFHSLTFHCKTLNMA
jgi:hypothetical protein